jgi:hypothetical protein
VPLVQGLPTTAPSNTSAQGEPAGPHAWTPLRGGSVTVRSDFGPTQYHAFSMSYTPSRLGQVNATGDTLALFLKNYAREVLTAFERYTVMMIRHLVRFVTFLDGTQNVNGVRFASGASIATIPDKSFCRAMCCSSKPVA